ncbi:MAG: BTAD domain-containing putative transcriptional regulator [Pseudonocardiaceae bacterium]
MEFGVLGPLAVWSADGNPVRVPEAKVRALLADLLVHEGQAVPVDRLVGDLWGEQLPGNPTNTLQTKISALRAALRRAGGSDLVVHQPPGYLLRVPDGAVDVHRFRALIARARHTTDLGARAALLSDALALWRGPALADFADEPFARAMARRLDEERLVALEERAEARLALGEHRLLVGELGDLVARYPLRERLRELQLRALYRAGRQSEALDGYAELRQRLAGELGLDPGPELVALHQAILKQDPALAVPSMPATVRPRTNLTAPLTDLVGRTAALDAVRPLLDSARLVTLTGPGGVGKTRLAVETARRLVGKTGDGVWLVEFAGFDRHACPEASCPEDWVTEAVADVLGVRDDPASVPTPAGGPVELVDRLADLLRAKDILLVLDNCESVIEPVAALVHRLLQTAPHLRILATSQLPLGLAAEVLWAVAPLELPARGGNELSSVQESSAVRLFVARAAASAPGFDLNAGNAVAVAEICRRLDGIPLALELAATRMRALGVHELLSRLDDRFRLLTGTRRAAPARQQTLRAVIDWSWDLLTGAQRTVLRRLAIHAEGCTLDAAEAVCAGDGVRPGEVLELLAGLVDRSLVDVNHHHFTGQPRYRLLESVAAYGLEQLREAGEFEHLRRRHSHYYVRLAERAEPRLRGPEQRQWLERLDAEAANLRAALETLAQHGPADLALRLVNALLWYWFLRGRLGEARRSLRVTLSVADSTPGSAHATAVAWQAGLAVLAGDHTDDAAAAQALDIDDPAVRGPALWFLGYVSTTLGDMAAQRLTARALADFRNLGDSWGIAAALCDRASQAMTKGDLAAARRDATEAAELFDELEDRWGQLQASYALGTLAEITGDYEQAARRHRDGLRKAEELGLWPEASYQLSWLGRIALLTGEHAQAREFHQRAERLAAECGFTPGEMYARTGLALGARREGKLDIAEQYLRPLLDWHRQVNLEPGNTLILAELGFIAEQRGDAVAAGGLHLDGFVIARRTGVPRAVALAVEGLAGAHALAGDHELAARLLGAAARTRQSVGAPLPAAERGDVDRITSAARNGLGEQAFQAAFDHGIVLELDELHDLALNIQYRPARAVRELDATNVSVQPHVRPVEFTAPSRPSATSPSCRGRP